MADLATNLLCRYRCNEGTGTNFADAGMGNVSATASGITWGTSGGYPAVVFDDLNDYVNRATPITAADVTDQMSVFVRANPASAGSYPVLVSNTNSNTSSGFELWLEAGSGVPRFVLHGANNVTSTSPSIVGAEHSVLCVYNGVDLRIYVDGVLACTPVSHTGNVNFANVISLKLGNRVGSTSQPYSGSMRDVRIYNRALTAEDAAALHAYTQPTLYVDEVTDGTIYQRDKNTNRKTITLTGPYATLPTTLEVQTYQHNTNTIVQSWTPAASATITGGTYSLAVNVPAGDMYNFEVRSKDASGAVLHTSDRTTRRRGVGILVACLGQSNMVGMFGNADSPAAAHPATAMHTASGWASVAHSNGARSLANGIRAGTSMPVGLLNYAVGGTTISQWTNTGGSQWTAFIAGLTAVGGDCEIVLWHQGETDAINGTSKATYKAGLTTLYSNLRTATGRNTSELPFGCALVGNIDHVSATDASMQAIRQGQQEWISETTGVFFAGSSVDCVTNGDGLHWTAPYYGRMGLRYAQAVLHRYGLESYGAEGPRIRSATISGDTVTVTVVHDGGSALKELDGSTDGGSVTGFQVSNDNFATTLTISSTAFSGNTIVLTLSTTPTGNVKLRYQYGETPVVTNPVYDNTSPAGDTLGLPLQPKVAIPVALAGAGGGASHINTGIGVGI